MYETCSLSEDTVALHIMQLDRQFPSRRQANCFLQLYVFAAALVSLSFIICILCALIIIIIIVSHATMTYFYVLFVQEFVGYF